jgi:hypothetical protein
MCWLARCDYVAKLVDPSFKREGKYEEFTHWGRFFNEQWVHLHPSLQACDVYTGPEFSWGHANVPVGDFKMDLQMAPRFEFDIYVQAFPRPDIEKPKDFFVSQMMK